MRPGFVVWVVLAVSCNRKIDDNSRPPPPPVTPADARAAPPVDAAETAAKLVPPETPARRLWTPKIEDAATFDAYSEELGGERFAKFVVDLKSDAIYYFDVNVYKVHKDFIFQALFKKPKTREAVRIFDKNYGP